MSSAKNMDIVEAAVYGFLSAAPDTVTAIRMPCGSGFVFHLPNEDVADEVDNMGDYLVNHFHGLKIRCEVEERKRYWFVK